MTVPYSTGNDPTKYEHSSFIKAICIYMSIILIIYYVMSAIGCIMLNAQNATETIELSSKQDDKVDIIVEYVETEDETATEIEVVEIETDVETEETIIEDDQTPATPIVDNADGDFGMFKSYTDYKCLSKSSPQWKLQEQAYTDENGLRKIGDAYLVALGSYYGVELGTEYVVTLSNGNSFNIILCDVKNDIHTDDLNRECLANGSVLEFYVESSALPQIVKLMGTISSIDFFNGSVVSITKIN